MSQQKPLRQHLESRISEVCLGHSSSYTELMNCFSRPVTVEGKNPSSLSKLLGFCSSGLRTALFLQGEELYGSFSILNQARKQKLALVAHWQSDWDYTPYFAASNSGLFQLFAGTVQEEADLTLIAHRIAELSLVPGLVAVDSPRSQSEDSDPLFPSDAQIRDYLGSPEDWIEAPTPAQEIIFGKHRPRIPRWFSPDQPVLLGVMPESRRRGLEALSQKSYFGAHLQELMAQAFSEFRMQTGRSYSPLIGYEFEGAKEIILVQGSLTPKVISGIEKLRARRKHKLGCLQLLSFRPFPKEALIKALKNSRALTVLEPCTGSLEEDSVLFREVQSVVASLKNITLFSGSLTSPDLDEQDLEAILENMARSRGSIRNFVLGSEFSRKSSLYPRREILHQSLRREYPGLDGQVLRAKNRHEFLEPEQKDAEIQPMALRRFQEKGPVYSRLADFKDRVTSFYVQGLARDQIADPFQAIPAIPPASASLMEPSGEKSGFLKIDPEKCTGCSDCILHCPHGALRPSVLSLESLLNAGVQIAVAKAQPLGPLVPLLKNLAKAASKIIRDEPHAFSRLSQVLEGSFEKLSSKMNLEGERKDRIEADFQVLIDSFGSYPVSITQDHFSKPETLSRGSGELYSLSIDPSACTLCGNCVSHCEEEAIAEVEEGLEARKAAFSQLEIWENLPDIAGDSLKRLSEDPDFNPLTALLLSRNYSMSILGAHSKNEESLASVVIRAVSAITESVVQPKFLALIANVDSLIQSLQGQLKSLLAEKLPVDQLQSLDETLAGEDRQILALDSLLSSLEQRPSQSGLNVETLRRQSALLKELQNFRWVLEEGATGLGRSRYSLVVVGSEKLGFCESFPANLFTVPVLVSQPEEAMGSAMGTLQAQRRHYLDNMRLLHRARLEVKGGYDPRVHEKSITELGYEDLSDLEKSAIPRVIMIAESSYLESQAQGGLAELSVSSLPVKLLVLDPVIKADLSRGFKLSPATRLGLKTTGLGGIFLSQTSLSRPRHFYSSIQEALGFEGPALIQTFCPAQNGEGTSPTPSTASLELALNSRLYPCFKFNPGNKHGSGALISVDGNPDPEKGFMQEEDSSTLVSPLHWAALQDEFKGCFSPVSEKDSNLMDLVEYLHLDPEQRQGKRVEIKIEHKTKGKAGQIARLIPSVDLLDSCEEIYLNWKVLQEASGVDNPFAKYGHAELRSKFESLRGSDREVLEKDFDARAEKLNQDFMETARIRVRDRLLEMTQGAK